MTPTSHFRDDLPRGAVSDANLAYAYRHYGPSWLSCGFWVLSLCPWWCRGIEGKCQGHPLPDSVFGDDPDPF